MLLIPLQSTTWNIFTMMKKKKMQSKAAEA